MRVTPLFVDLLIFVSVRLWIFFIVVGFIILCNTLPGFILLGFIIPGNTLPGFIVSGFIG